ncbi:AraC-type DNA-binding domain-containing protein [Marinomonas sp. MED121]|uniref:AraC family transcriptional regulator n=1 Tax=Marinomonas sp. MED121 TaxID=314277 RepID=UPI000068FBB7|nr:AraC family transcriptional regulator [Marinomonas sp. MED121]EAQ65000.1 AraC-type DNA-binding domain-containing protein [Marinomonas sp. MED121]
MLGKITIRTYNPHSRAHSHDFHQILIPTQGFIDLKLDGIESKASSGHCVVIKAGCFHEFKAHEEFRFIVIDVSEMPPELMQLETSRVSLNEAAIHYIQFIEKQLQNPLEPDFEKSLIKLLFDLLIQQDFREKIDERVQACLNFLAQDIARPHSIEELANIACLSPTQFKHVFSKNMKMPPLQYLAKLRIEKAKTLLQNTDLPISQIAQEVGFANQSSFTRSFTQSLGQTPKLYRQNTSLA